MRRKIYTLGLLFAVGTAFAQTANGNNVYFVKQGSATGDKQGDSWANSHGDLGAVLAKIASLGKPATVYVFKGTYTPTRNKAYGAGILSTDRQLSFRIPAGVKIFGGFTSDNQTNENDRVFSSQLITENSVKYNKAIDQTILSGTYSAEQSYYNVVVMKDAGSSVLDGVSITGGVANGSGNTNNEGMNKAFGGGVHIQAGELLIRNSFIYGNKANDRGAAVYVESTKGQAHLNLINTVVYDNECNGDGSAVFVTNSGHAYLINSTVSKNRTKTSYGALHVKDAGTFDLYNTIVWNNTDKDGKIKNLTGGNDDSSNFKVYNSIINAGSNPDGQSGNGHNNGDHEGLINFTSVDPLFFNENKFDFTLTALSSAIGQGDNARFDSKIPLAGNPKNLFGGNRLVAGTIDIGAFEYQTPIVPVDGNILYVNKSATGNGDGSSFTNGIVELADALKWANMQNTITNKLEIKVATGDYSPKYTASNLDLVGDQKSASFVLVKNVSLLGGFDPITGEVVKGLNSKKSVLKGNGNYHLVIAAGDKSTNSTLDGFEIANGNASGDSSNIDVNGQSLNSKFGGGLMIQGATVKGNNLIFKDNKAKERGSAVYVEKQNNIGGLILSNSLIYNNSASDGTTLEGSAIYLNNGAEAKVVNSTITNNISNSNSGGALHVKDGSKFFIYNTIAWDNKNTSGKLLNLTGGNDNSNNFEVYNSIINYGSNPDGQGGNGHNNGDNENKIQFKSYNPKFVDPKNNFTVRAISPTINKGNKANYDSLAKEFTLDIYGNDRFDDSSIDIGAVQSSVKVGKNPRVLYVNSKVTGGNQTGDTFVNAIPNLADALQWVSHMNNNYTESNPLEIRVAAGTHKPMYSFNTTDGLDFEANGDARNYSFFIPNNVIVKGNFDAATDRQNNSGQESLTILSGAGSTPSDARKRHIVVTTPAYGKEVTATLENVVIERGDASGNGDLEGVNNLYGGGVYVDNATLNLKNVVAKSNKSIERGGALYAENNAVLNVINSLLYDNDSDGDGSAMYSNTNAKINVINSTIANNISRDSNNGGALHVKENGSFKVKNSILWNNIRETNDRKIVSLSGGNAGNFEVSSSIMNAGSTSHVSDKIDYDTADPNFENLPANNFRLTSGSTAVINKGVNRDYPLAEDKMAAELDVFGNKRFIDTIIDLGALEYQTSLSVGDVAGTFNKVYPNPTTGIFFIDATQTETVTIHNMAGQLMKSINVKVGRNQIDITNLAAGLYIVTGEKSTHKIIKK